MFMPKKKEKRTQIAGSTECTNLKVNISSILQPLKPSIYGKKI